jgi:hypothetical protein
MDIVQHQQEKIEQYEQLMTLKGIWKQLLHITQDHNFNDMEENCSIIMSWLSIKCAEDVTANASSVSSNQASNQKRHRQQDAVSNIHINDFIIRISQYFNEMDDKYRQLHSTTNILENNNNHLNKMLSERNDRCNALMTEMETYKSQIIELENMNKQQNEEIR